MSKCVWIDLENSPHVPFFIPIISGLMDKGFKVIVTAKDAYQTKELAEYHGLACKCIGRHAGKNRYLKVLYLIVRVFQLILYIYRIKPDIAVCHGSRALRISANILKIKSVVIFDYEFTQAIPFFKSDYHICPDVLKRNISIHKDTKIFWYSGIKENIYVPFF
jgi:predicted glycosyltransferase